MIDVNWDSIEESTNYEPLEPGAYAAVVTDIIDHPDKLYLEVRWDFAEGDRKGSIVDCDKRNGWIPRYGRFYMTYDTKKKRGMGLSKKFIIRLEQTNRGFKWSNPNYRNAIGKYFGVVLGEEEYQSQGQIKRGLYVADWLSGDELRSGNYKIPDFKPYKGAAPVPAAPAPNYYNPTPYAPPTEQQWVPIDEDDGHLPF